MRLFLFLCLTATAMTLGAGEFDFQNANFKLTFATRGGMIKKLIHNNVDWNAAGPGMQGFSFCDSRLGQTVAPKTQFHEDFSKLEYELVSWRSGKRATWADLTFSVKGAIYDWLRMNKTYKIRPGNTLEVVYELVNTGKTPRFLSFSTRNFFHRADRENIYWQPSVKGIRKLKQQRYMFFSKLPPETFLAIGGEDDSGMLIEYPADTTAGFMNWFIRERSASTEFFSDEKLIAPGGKRTFVIKLHFTRDLNKLIAEKKFTARPVRGKIPAMVDHLNLREDSSYKIKTLKKEPPKDSRFFDVKLKAQFKDSWRAVTLPEDTPLDKIAVFQLKNGAAVFDRPVGYVLNGRELLLKVPGFHPEGDPRRSSLKNGVLTEKFGAKKSYSASDFNCRIFYARTDGVRLKEKAPAGGDLVPNGSFDLADGKNPAVPAYHSSVANKNYKAQYLNKGGPDNSPCLRGGTFIFPMIPEPGRAYDVSLSVKNEGTGTSLFCWFFFYDADGKRLRKYNNLMVYTKQSSDWRTVKKKIFAPDGAAMMELYVRRVPRGSARVLLDNVSVKAEPVSCVRITPLEQGRKELKERWGVPLEYLEQLSLAAANPHKKWFTPSAEKADVLYLPFENGKGKLLRDKRIIVELAQRMPMNIKVIPVLRRLTASTGIYSVHVASFGKDLSTYTAESFKALPKAPKVVLITEMNHKQFTDDLQQFFAKWQKGGTHFIIFSGTFFPALQGKQVKAPVKFLLPEMKRSSHNYAVSWYRKDRSYVVYIQPRPWGNPVIPKAMENNAVRERIVYTGRDFPWWEYQNLAKLQVLRYLAGVKTDASLVSGSEKELVIKSRENISATVELEYFNTFRDLKSRKRFKTALKQGINTIALPAVALPGGVSVANIRLLDAEGNVIDAGALCIKRAQTVRIQLAFKKPDRIYPRGKDLVFTLKLANVPAGSVIETEVEDTFGRIISRKSFPAKAVQTLTLPLSAPRTVINNLICRISNRGRILAESIHEFSSPEGPTDFTEFFAMTWGFQRYLARYLEFNGATGNAPYSKYMQDTFRCARYENIAMSPMGLASVRSDAYRSDVKSDPVRKPCFHDPAYLAKNTQLMDQSFSRNNLLLYYDIRDFWSGDEQFLGSSVCYSPHCLKKFREVLKKEYKNIDALNREWGTRFASFDVVVPQQLNELKSRENLAPWLTHKLFMASTFAWGQFGSHLPDLRKYNPHARMGASGTQEPGYSYDWAQYMKHCQVMSYYDGIQVKLIHDLGGKNILAGRWMTYCYANADQETYCVSPMWEGLLRGSNMAAIWPPSMVNGDGVPTRNARFVKAVMDELRNGITKLWLTGTAKPRIALLYSQSSLYTAMGTFGGSEWLNSQSSWLKLLDDMKYDCCYLSYEEVAEKGIPPQYKVLILPCAVSISKAEAIQLEKFVKRGGTLLADFSPGRYNGRGKRHNCPILAKLFTPFSGRIHIAYTTLPRLGGRFKTAEKGLPQISEKRYGKGRAVNFNISLSDYHFIRLGGTGGELSSSMSADARVQLAMRNMVRKQLEYAGVRPSMKVTDARGNELPCMTLIRWDGSTGTAALYKVPESGWGHSVTPPPHDRIDRKKGHAVTVTLPFKGHLYDSRSGKYLGYSNSFKSFLVPGIANFFSIQKQKVTGVAVKAPAAVRAGETVKISFTAAGATGPQVFNINVFDPAGKIQRIYRKNLRMPTSGGTCSFQIPFNAPGGSWQIAVTHVNTGLKSFHRIRVR